MVRVINSSIALKIGGELPQATYRSFYGPSVLAVVVISGRPLPDGGPQVGGEYKSEHEPYVLEQS